MLGLDSKNQSEWDSKWVQGIYHKVDQSHIKGSSYVCGLHVIELENALREMTLFVSKILDSTHDHLV